jgi:hypothetical protein
METSDDFCAAESTFATPMAESGGIIPDGWSVVVPLSLKDNALSGAETSDDDFAQLPRGFFAKCCRAEGLLRTSEPFVVEGAIASLERLAREAETLSQGGALPWDHNYDPGPTRAAAARVAQPCAEFSPVAKVNLEGCAIQRSWLAMRWQIFRCWGGYRVTLGCTFIAAARRSVCFFCADVSAT